MLGAVPGGVRAQGCRPRGTPRGIPIIFKLIYKQHIYTITQISKHKTVQHNVIIKQQIKQSIKHKTINQTNKPKTHIDKINQIQKQHIHNKSSKQTLRGSPGVP